MTMDKFHKAFVALIKEALESKLSLEDIRSDIAEIISEAEETSSQ